MKLSEWARKMGISYRRAWQMFKDGKLPIGTILEDEPRGVVLENTVAIYSRASGHEDKDDLERQAERLKEYVLAKGYKIIHVVKEVGSGVKDTRPKLIELLRKKDYRILLVGHKDRLTRFGFNYIKLLFEEQGKTIEIVNGVEDEKEDLIKDFVSVIYSSTLCKQRKSSKNPWCY